MWYYREPYAQDAYYLLNKGKLKVCARCFNTEEEAKLQKRAWRHCSHGSIGGDDCYLVADLCACVRCKTLLEGTEECRSDYCRGWRAALVSLGMKDPLSVERKGPKRCPVRESGGVRCEAPEGHEGYHDFSEALRRLYVRQMNDSVDLLDEGWPAEIS